MISRRTLFAALVLLPMFGAAAHAGPEKPFTAAALSAAQTAGKPVLVAVHAPWCSTCKAQGPIIERLAGDARFKDLVILHVDFDSQKEALRALDVRMQSTLIVYHGKTEKGRSVGDTRPQSIEALLVKAL